MRKQACPGLTRAAPIFVLLEAKIKIDSVYLGNLRAKLYEIYRRGYAER